jgi:hypothetical protein
MGVWRMSGPRRRYRGSCHQCCPAPVSCPLQVTSDPGLELTATLPGSPPALDDGPSYPEGWYVHDSQHHAQQHLRPRWRGGGGGAAGGGAGAAAGAAGRPATPPSPLDGLREPNIDPL